MQCLILAGGRGTRMEPFTAQTPKALIPIHGKPFIAHLLRHLKNSGVGDVALSIGYKGEQIRDYVKDGAAWGVAVRYVDEGSKPLGTGGALRLAIEKGALESAFLMTYGDSFLPIDFSGVWRYFQESRAPILMTVYKNDNQWGSSNVIFDGKKVTQYDKTPTQRPPDMRYIDYGLLAFQRGAVEKALPPGTSDLAELLKQASLRGDLAGMEVSARFYEAGTPEGVRQLSDYLKTQGAA